VDPRRFSSSRRLRRGPRDRCARHRGREKPEEIDEERAREAEKRARERLAVGKAEGAEEIDLLRAEAALRRALMRLKAREHSAS
jgi:hypothetical protein